jgi:hypothetical protein
MNICNHYITGSLVINLCTYELTLTKILIPTSVIENIRKNKEDVI